MRISGRITIDCRAAAGFHDDWTGQRLDRLVQSATYAPPGADVILIVACDSYPPACGIDFLVSEGGHIGSLTVDCSDGETVCRWLRAIREAQASRIAA